MNEAGALASLEAERRELSQLPAARRALRPRDAASLVIVNQEGGTTRVLMGRRAARHVFMPGRYVFPGGRVDPGDRAQAGSFAISGPATERLCAGPPARFGPAEAVAAALAAIRETFEETGVMVGRRQEGRSVAGVWEDFSREGLRPAPEELVPFARAVTPPGPPRRFDARFFCAPASAIGRWPAAGDVPNDELEGVEWFRLDRLDEMSLAPITRRILADLEARITEGSWLDASRPMPFYRYVRGRFVRELI